MKVLVIAHEKLPAEEVWELLSNLSYETTEVSIRFTEPGKGVISQCRSEPPNVILDMAHSLAWSSAFLLRKSMYPELTDVEYVCIAKEQFLSKEDPQLFAYIKKEAQTDTISAGRELRVYRGTN